MTKMLLLPARAFFTAQKVRFSQELYGERKNTKFHHFKMLIKMKILCLLSTRYRSQLSEYLPHSNDPPFWGLILTSPHKPGCQAAMLIPPGVDTIPRLGHLLSAKDLPLGPRAKEPLSIWLGLQNVRREHLRVTKRNSCYCPVTSNIS